MRTAVFVTGSGDGDGGNECKNDEKTITTSPQKNVEQVKMTEGMLEETKQLHTLIHNLNKKVKQRELVTEIKKKQKQKAVKKEEKIEIVALHDPSGLDNKHSEQYPDAAIAQYKASLPDVGLADKLILVEGSLVYSVALGHFPPYSPTRDKCSKASSCVGCSDYDLLCPTRVRPIVSSYFDEPHHSVENSHHQQNNKLAMLNQLYMLVVIRSPNGPSLVLDKEDTSIQAQLQTVAVFNTLCNTLEHHRPMTCVDPFRWGQSSNLDEILVHLKMPPLTKEFLLHCAERIWSIPFNPSRTKPLLFVCFHFEETLKLLPNEADRVNLRLLLPCRLQVHGMDVAIGDLRVPDRELLPPYATLLTAFGSAIQRIADGFARQSTTSPSNSKLVYKFWEDQHLLSNQLCMILAPSAALNAIQTFVCHINPFCVESALHPHLRTSLIKLQEQAPYLVKNTKGRFEKVWLDWLAIVKEGHNFPADRVNAALTLQNKVNEQFASAAVKALVEKCCNHRKGVYLRIVAAMASRLTDEQPLVEALQSKQRVKHRLVGTLLLQKLNKAYDVTMPTLSTTAADVTALEKKSKTQRKRENQRRNKNLVKKDDEKPQDDEKRQDAEKTAERAPDKEIKNKKQKRKVDTKSGEVSIKFSGTGRSSTASTRSQSTDDYDDANDTPSTEEEEVTSKNQKQDHVVDEVKIETKTKKVVEPLQTKSCTVAEIPIIPTFTQQQVLKSNLSVQKSTIHSRSSTSSLSESQQKSIPATNLQTPTKWSLTVQSPLLPMPALAMPTSANSQQSQHANTLKDNKWEFKKPRRRKQAAAPTQQVSKSKLKSSNPPKTAAKSQQVPPPRLSEKGSERTQTVQVPNTNTQVPNTHSRNANLVSTHMSGSSTISSSNVIPSSSSSSSLAVSLVVPSKLQQLDSAIISMSLSPSIPANPQQAEEEKVTQHPIPTSLLAEEEKGPQTKEKEKEKNKEEAELWLIECPQCSAEMGVENSTSDKSNSVVICVQCGVQFVVAF